MSKHVLVTGATSFIAVELIKLLLEQNYQLTAVIRPFSKNIKRLPRHPFLCIVPLDLDQISNLPKQINSFAPDFFIHFAWEGVRAPQRDNETQQKSNFHAIEQAMFVASKMGCKTFVGIGSQAEYGEVKGLVNEHNVCNPSSQYGIYKLMAFHRLSEIAKQTDIRLIWPRIFSVYGPNDYTGSLIMSSVSKMSKNQPVSISFHGRLWDFLYVTDAAQALISLVNTVSASGVYNVAMGQSQPLGKYIIEMKKVLNSKSDLIFQPCDGNMTKVNGFTPSIEKLQFETGWEPTVNFHEGILRTANSAQ
ncbi:MAG: NAD-dependent epimerase/dehydratase family protein [Suipraeoptans sp.]